eukprot:TRINITY_DN8166_c0_g1_i4.p1 TRINITY_DN8166_c0_g1~~TRINITY_DN8166_c0_g1_i4.p1  ORF type:complete len:253 (+),score=-21.79 TRINITY_DN8166_c0_g1_i4:654-1412(+)
MILNKTKIKQNRFKKMNQTNQNKYLIFLPTLNIQIPHPDQKIIQYFLYQVDCINHQIKSFSKKQSHKFDNYYKNQKYYQKQKQIQNLLQNSSNFIKIEHQQKLPTRKNLILFQIQVLARINFFGKLRAQCIQVIIIFLQQCILLCFNNSNQQFKGQNMTYLRVLQLLSIYYSQSCIKKLTNILYINQNKIILFQTQSKPQQLLKKKSHVLKFSAYAHILEQLYPQVLKSFFNKYRQPLQNKITQKIVCFFNF